MSDTPRTDTEALKWGPHDDVMNVVIPADFARELERDLGAANRSCDACLREIDSLRAQLNAKSPEVAFSKEAIRVAQMMKKLQDENAATSHAEDVMSEAILRFTLPEPQSSEDSRG